MDFNWITHRLATGALIGGFEDAQLIAQAGVTHVVDCISGSDDTQFFAAVPGMHVLFNPTDDDGQAKPVEWFARSLAFSLEALAQPNSRVYAHCAAGVNRGPSTAYAVLRALGWTPESGEALIRLARPQVGLRYKADADAAVTALGYE